MSYRGDFVNYPGLVDDIFRILCRLEFLLHIYMWVVCSEQPEALCQMKSTTDSKNGKT